MEVVDILKKYSKDIDVEIKNSLDTVDPEELQKINTTSYKGGWKKNTPFTGCYKFRSSGWYS